MIECAHCGRAFPPVCAQHIYCGPRCQRLALRLTPVEGLFTGELPAVPRLLRRPRQPARAWSDRERAVLRETAHLPVKEALATLDREGFTRTYKQVDQARRRLALSASLQ